MRDTSNHGSGASGVLTADTDISRWFEALLADTAQRQGRPVRDVAERAANWMTGELFGALNRLGLEVAQSPVTPAQGGELLALLADGTLSGPLAKQVFEIMLETREDRGAIAEARGLKQLSDTGALEAAIAVGSRPEMKDKTIVVIIPSFGERYLSTELYAEYMD